MNYTSYTFWLLFVLVFAVYWRLQHRQQNNLLLVASYVFYGFWDYRFLFLILVSTIIDYIGGLGVAGRRLPAPKLRKLGMLLVGSAFLLCSGIRYGDLWRGVFSFDSQLLAGALPHQARELAIPLGVALLTLAYGLALPRLYALPEAQRRKCFLTISMVANLAILGFFKYCDFFITSLHGLLASIGAPEMSLQTLGIILPAGISFYTFQAMSYTIDIYRGQVEPTENFGDFALFVCFFPHLVAGPIMRAHTLLPQVLKPRRLDARAIEEGFVLVLMGLFKKLVIADNMALIANAVFSRFTNGTGAELTGPEVLIGIYAFAFQIYGDFSGYSSIARGISKWLGYELIINFDLPYLAVSPSDFWRRWHISLSTWLRDYLYIPLGGNRKGLRMTYRNLLITMLLGGLWHGANWNFLAWGLYQGVILCLFRVFQVSDEISLDTLKGRLHWLARVVFMFHLTCLGWVIFRCTDLGAAAQIVRTVLTNFAMTPIALVPLILLVFYCGALFALEWALGGERRLERLLDAPWLAQGTVYSYLLLMTIIFRAEQVHEFIYFQF